MKSLYKLKDYRETIKFEKEHPKPLQWDASYKLYMLEQNDNCQGIWLKDGVELVGEIIFSWDSDNVLQGESLTVLPSHQGKGLAHQLFLLALEWGRNSDFKHYIGAARNGAAWKVVQNVGGTEVLRYINWTGTNEEYISYKINL